MPNIPWLNFGQYALAKKRGRGRKCNLQLQFVKVSPPHFWQPGLCNSHGLMLVVCQFWKSPLWPWFLRRSVYIFKMDKRKVNIESKNLMDAHWRNYDLTGPFQQEFCTSQDVADRNNKYQCQPYHQNMLFRYFQGWCNMTPTQTMHLWGPNSFKNTRLSQWLIPYITRRVIQLPFFLLFLLLLVGLIVRSLVFHLTLHH